MATRLFAGITDPLFEACGDAPGLVCEWVLELSGNASAARFADWFVAKPLKILLIFLIALVVNRLLRRAIGRMIDRLIMQREEDDAQSLTDEAAQPRRLAGLRSYALEKAQALAAQRERRRQRAQALGMVLRSIAAITVYALATIIAIAEFGVSLGPLVAGAGIVGVALGFGAQSLVRDFLSGIFMLVEDQYGVGDIVDVGDAAGVVEEVTLRTTRLRDLEGTVWYVPNGQIRRVGNKSQRWARAVLDMEVAYDTDLDHASAVMKAVADEVWHAGLDTVTVIEEPEVIGIDAFGDSAITLRLLVKVEPGQQFTAARELRWRMKEAFDREGIEIPFPQRTVWTRHETAEAGEQAPDRKADG